ncbi:winged helix-turn-helix transcriptional regulator [Conchiformibius kuhniae]|uniref:Winged helix-turn-helix transcriptional regulator n=1 Tax=Conchiformibius kuhniae TaxID=211502 RepID=A0A8T9MVR2_9NEIS|nr:helix-turn-helix domain-containing protein [Conchiformibius kuhniae]UOP05214.1 helix-turn-helix transcriptional regulator [Conchiformibius kuhniae]
MQQNWCGSSESELAAYRQTVCQALRMLEGKWKIVIIFRLMEAGQPVRFSELARQIDGISQKMLIQQLKSLEQDGLLQRTVYPQVPPRVEYALSEWGWDLSDAVKALIVWEERRPPSV